MIPNSVQEKVSFFVSPSKLENPDAQEYFSAHRCKLCFSVPYYKPVACSNCSSIFCSFCLKYIQIRSENICPVCKASQCLSTDPCPAHGKEFTDKTDSSESIPLKKTCRISSDYLPSSFPRFLKSRVKIGDMSVKLVNLDSYFAKRMKCPSPSTTNPSTLLPLILPSLPSPETQESPPVTDEDEEAGIDPDDPGFLKWYKRFDYRMQSKLRERIDYSSQETRTRNFSLKLFLY
ncbi:hypothetical protein ADUPG1_013629, partial [Aduncisulcus paluster]